jgi:hypothetical protein
MEAYNPAYVFVLDQGSRQSPPLVSDPNVCSLVIDHHHATPADFPERSSHVTACISPPIATSSLLTYELCLPLHPSVHSLTAWLAIVGTHGDLGTTLKWLPPFPDMAEPLKRYKKKVLNGVVSLLNAPRRTATYDVRSAWDALATTSEPTEVLNNPRLLSARQEVNAEVERCTHAAPKFSADGKVAVFRIRSEAQVHPVIATRWAGHLKSNALEIVMVANEGYLPGKVNFSCRIARCAKGREEEVNIIQSLRAYASLPGQDAGDGSGEIKPPLLERVGDDFARGHVQASGGIVNESVDRYFSTSNALTPSILCCEDEGMAEVFWLSTSSFVKTSKLDNVANRMSILNETSALKFDEKLIYSSKTYKSKYLTRVHSTPI